MNLKEKKELLSKRIPRALAKLTCCDLCPRNCGVNRTCGETGLCKTADHPVVYGYMPHHGEEPPLSGTRGSGTIFFTHCNLRCCFCQNQDISLKGDGEAADPEQIALSMIRLQEMGCHNINFVTPTHVVPFILQALDKALDMGLDLPLVYNSSGYENPSTLALLDGIVDIYLPDFKFWDPKVADMACKAPDYPRAARLAVKIMHHQVGDLMVDKKGIATRGLLVRHLVMPNNLAGTASVMEFLADKISPKTAVNVMSQYRPVGKAHTIPELSRPTDAVEYRQAVQIARQYGLRLMD